MRRFSCAVSALTVALVATLPVLAQVQGQWVTTGPLQSPREFNAQVLLASGKVMSIGGVDNNGNILASAEVYSPASGVWALTSKMAEARKLFAAVVLTNGRVLVSGGMGPVSSVLSATELYDPATGLWSSAGFLAVARFGHTATVLPSGEVLVTGGCPTINCSSATAVSELYNPATNTWTTTGNLNTARYYHAAVKLKTGKVMVVGGSTGSPTNSCELYDPSTGKWSAAASTNAVRYLHAITLLPDGKVLVTGGAIGRYPVSSAELYDPTANTWMLTGSMLAGRYAHTATLLPDGTVMVAGGEGQSISCGKACTGYIPTAKTEIYSEATGKFTAAASLNRAEAYHSATLLGSGRALADGGVGTTSTCCIVLNTAQAYTPLSLTFSASSLNFGLLQIGLTSTSQTVTVTNVSGHSVSFTSITISGDFSRSYTCPTTLNAGLNCTITIAFKPTAAGTRAGAVTLSDNSPGSPTQTLALTGTGETLALGFTPASLNLGSVPVGSSSVQTATVTNDGAAAVNITGFSISPADDTFTETNNCPTTLGVQQTCTVQVVFTPPDVFTYNATLSVANGAGSATTLPLSGAGLDGP